MANVYFLFGKHGSPGSGASKFFEEVEPVIEEHSGDLVLLSEQVFDKEEIKSHHLFRQFSFEMEEPIHSEPSSKMLKRRMIGQRIVDEIYDQEQYLVDKTINQGRERTNIKGRSYEYQDSLFGCKDLILKTNSEETFSVQVVLEKQDFQSIKLGKYNREAYKKLISGKSKEEKIDIMEKVIEKRVKSEHRRDNIVLNQVRNLSSKVNNIVVMRGLGHYHMIRNINGDDLKIRVKQERDPSELKLSSDFRPILLPMLQKNGELDRNVLRKVAETEVEKIESGLITKIKSGFESIKKIFKKIGRKSNEISKGLIKQQ